MHPISAGTAFKQPSFEALQREAAQLGAKIKLVRGFRLLGAWEADTGTIYMREGLPSPERECVLAHELEHAIRGDAGPQSPETEAWIDIEVARRFVDPWEYTCAEKSGGGGGSPNGNFAGSAHLGGPSLGEEGRPGSFVRSLRIKNTHLANMPGGCFFLVVASVPAARGLIKLISVFVTKTVP